VAAGILQIFLLNGSPRAYLAGADAQTSEARPSLDRAMPSECRTSGGEVDRCSCSCARVGGRRNNTNFTNNLFGGFLFIKRPKLPHPVGFNLSTTVDFLKPS